jgi:hypothetical protein
MIQSVLRFLAVLGALLLAGCAANQLPGFQNTYYSYNVPESLLEQIRIEFRNNRLPNARIGRDNVGRVQLKGSYQNEDEVDDAFIIVQSAVGIKSTSPFYPEYIKDKRWGIAAGNALAQHAKANRVALAKPQKRALIIGINTFRDSGSFLPIPGEDDAAVAKSAAEKAGYVVTALLGKNATKSNIEAALRNMDRDLGVDDSLFIYISSHGTQPLPTSKGGDGRKMSIVAWDSTPYVNGKGSNINIQKTSVSDVEVQKLVKKPTRNTRILIDTCYSGEMLKYISDDSRRYILQTNGGQPEHAGIVLSSWTGQEYSSKGIHFNEESAPVSAQTNGTTRQKNLKQDPVELTRAYTIITATSEGEESLAPLVTVGTFFLAPNRTLKGSYFTQAFFAYLKDSNGHVELAFSNARKFTRDNAINVSRGKKHQVPRSYSTISADQSNL